MDGVTTNHLSRVILFWISAPSLEFPRLHCASQSLRKFCEMTDSWASFPKTGVQRAEVRKLCFTKLPGNCGAACFQWVFETHHPGPLKCIAPCLNKTLLERCVLRLPSCIHPSLLESRLAPTLWLLGSSLLLKCLMRVLTLNTVSPQSLGMVHSWAGSPGWRWPSCIHTRFVHFRLEGPTGHSTFCLLKKKLFHEQYIIVIKEKNI